MVPKSSAKTTTRTLNPDNRTSSLVEPRFRNLTLLKIWPIVNAMTVKIRALPLSIFNTVKTKFVYPQKAPNFDTAEQFLHHTADASIHRTDKLGIRQLPRVPHCKIEQRQDPPALRLHDFFETNMTLTALRCH